MSYNASTVQASVSVDQTAYNLAMDYALRRQMYFDKVATVRPTALAHPGAAVTFTITSDLSAATTALNESTDFTPATMSDSQVTVVLAEHGNAVRTSAKLRGTSFLRYDPVVANIISFNAALSIDLLARLQLQAGSNVRFSSDGVTHPTARNQVEPDDNIKASDVRRARTDLVAANVQPTMGAYYTAFIHPDIAYDLRTETGAAAWRDPHTYQRYEEIAAGVIGLFEGFVFIETPGAPVFADAGSSTTLTDVYATLFVGEQSLAKAYSTTDGNGEAPDIRPTPLVDNLSRFAGLGWYWLGGYGRYREAAIRRLESASTIGAN